jgi:uncharacterized protein (TIGR03437 family)
VSILVVSGIASKILRVACGLLLCAGASCAQQYVISTVAGGAPPPPGAALGISLGSPVSVATDSTGSVYFTGLNCVLKLDRHGTVTRVAGTSKSGYSGDGGPAANAQLNNPNGLAVDASDNLFIADTINNRIRTVSTSGIITTVAGTGANGFSGDGGAAANAQLNNPYGIAVDGSGNLFVSDTFNNRIRKVSASGIIATVAGNGSNGISGDGGPAVSAQLGNPYGVAVDRSGNLLVAETLNNRIRKVSTGGIITTVVGTGSFGFSGDGSPAASAQLNNPNGIAVDASGNLFIADTFNDRIRKVSTGGIITTVAGIGAIGYSGDGGPAKSAQLYNPYGVAVDGSGNFFIADALNNRIREVSTSAIITTVAGDGTFGYSGDGGAATNAQLTDPFSIAVDGLANFFITDVGNNRVRKVSARGTITTVAGTGTSGFSGDGGIATSAQLYSPNGVAVDGSGNLFIADTNNNRIRKVSPIGIITTIAGTGARGFSGDGGAAVNAKLGNPYGVVVDGLGNLFIADSLNFRIRKVDKSGIITTVAGTGSNSFSGDGGAAASASLSNPSRVAVDGLGDLFITDAGNYRVRMVDTNGTITTIAGTGAPGFSGDGGTATSAQLNFPNGIAVDGFGDLFIADEANFRIRKVDTNGIITTVAGTGVIGYSGDGGPATSAQLRDPYAVAADPYGNVYAADRVNNAVRSLIPTNQSVLISAVVDAASESAVPVSPGKIVVIYGAGLGPSQLVQNQPANGAFGTQLAGTAVSFNGTPAPVIYTSATQVCAIVPYEIVPAMFALAQVTVSYQGSISSAFPVPVAAAAPGLFTANQTGAGQIATINALTGVFNDAAHPAKVGDYLELFATGEGQTAAAGVDGKLATLPYPAPKLPVGVTVGGIPAIVSYAGGAPTEVAGLMQVNIQIPPGVQPGGYVPIVLTVGNTSTVAGALWIAVAAN